MCDWGHPGLTFALVHVWARFYLKGWTRQRCGQDGAIHNEHFTESACIQFPSTRGFSPDPEHLVGFILPLPLWLKTIPALVKININTSKQSWLTSFSLPPLASACVILHLLDRLRPPGAEFRVWTLSCSAAAAVSAAVFTGWTCLFYWITSSNLFLRTSLWTPRASWRPSLTCLRFSVSTDHLDSANSERRDADATFVYFLVAGWIVTDTKCDTIA